MNELSVDERHKLEAIRDQKRGKDSNVMRAVALLVTDEGPHDLSMKDADVCKATGMTARTLERLRERCCQVGPLGALERKPRETPGREIRITGEVEARITQLACSKLINWQFTNENARIKLKSLYPAICDLRAASLAH